MFQGLKNYEIVYFNLRFYHLTKALSCVFIQISSHTQMQRAHLVTVSENTDSSHHRRPSLETQKQILS